jgi:hypothetical protein
MTQQLTEEILNQIISTQPVEHPNVHEDVYARICAEIIEIFNLPLTNQTAEKITNITAWLIYIGKEWANLNNITTQKTEMWH